MRWRITAIIKRNREIPGWDDMPAELRPVVVRQMETYAGYLEHADHTVGRLIGAFQAPDILEGTVEACLRDPQLATDGEKPQGSSMAAGRSVARERP
jgi:hypothetical protein